MMENFIVTPYPKLSIPQGGYQGKHPIWRYLDLGNHQTLKYSDLFKAGKIQSTCFFLALKAIICQPADLITYFRYSPCQSMIGW